MTYDEGAPLAYTPHCLSASVATCGVRSMLLLTDLCAGLALALS